MLFEGVDHLLGPAYGESGDNHLAAARKRLRHLIESAGTLIAGLVLPVAVGALDLQEVHVLHRGGITKNRIATPPHRH